MCVIIMRTSAALLTSLLMIFSDSCHLHPSDSSGVAVETSSRPWTCKLIYQHKLNFRFHLRHLLTGGCNPTARLPRSAAPPMWRSDAGAFWYLKSAQTLKRFADSSCLLLVHFEGKMEGSLHAMCAEMMWKCESQDPLLRHNLKNRKTHFYRIKLLLCFHVDPTASVEAAV